MFVNQPVYMSCDSVNVDPTTGVCSQPVWGPAPSLLPSLSAADGGAIAVAILAVWTAAYMARAFRVA